MAIRKESDKSDSLRIAKTAYTYDIKASLIPQDLVINLRSLVREYYYLVESISIKGIGFLSGVSLMCEIGDFSAFKKLKQLYAYFGLDPAVKESCNFKGTKISMSKRGSRIERKVIYAIALASVGASNNPVLKEYHEKKKQSKPKKVTLDAVMHKLCNIIFAFLRDKKTFVLIPL